MHGGTKQYSYDPYEMWGLPREGEEEEKKEEGPGGGHNQEIENNMLDLDEIIK